MKPGDKAGQAGSARSSVRADVITGGIVVAATLMFVWTGGTAISKAVRALAGIGAGVEQILMTALLLNVALILFGYRRYRDLQIEVEHRTAAEERARSLAATDPLTGFLNRRALVSDCQTLIHREQATGRAVALMLIDLDHFKTINDMHGHAAGDATLKGVSDRIAAALPPGSLVARLGGDEFACAAPFDQAHPEAVDALAQRLVNAVTQPLQYVGTKLTVSASLGIARSDSDGEQVELLMRRADIAMYAAKRRGRNCFVWFDIAMERELDARNGIETCMRQGIAAGEFIPYYEQQIDLGTGELLGFEMLARWHSPHMGEILPDVFIPIAEETGLIGELSFSVMNRALREARDWDEKLSLSVNISASQLKDAWLGEKILRMLVETGFSPRRLELELTESAVVENPELAKAIMISLKNQGIRIALDGFGTGYSSLATLRTLPFDRIKIDRSFVSGLGQNAEGIDMIRAITRLGESLGLPVSAEGVESARIEQQLKSLGLTNGQGWHFGKPMNFDDTSALLDTRRLAAMPPPAVTAHAEGRKAG